MKWIRNLLRVLQVRLYLLTGRYVPVEGGVNFYKDMKLGGIGVKGYYHRPMSYTTETIDFDALKHIDKVEIIMPRQR